MTLNVHIVAQCKNHGLDLSRKFAGRGEDKCLCLAHGYVDRLQHGDRKGSRFTGTRLGLCNDISTLRYGENGTLLNRGGLFKVCNGPCIREKEMREE